MVFHYMVKNWIIRAVFCAAFALPGLAWAEAAQAPASLAFGVGYYDIDKRNVPLQPAEDFRLEYRSGFDLLGLVQASNFLLQLRPMAGVEATSANAAYGFTGMVFEVGLGKHVVLSPNFAAGLYDPGEGKRLGCLLEFRSSFEVGYRFDNSMRLTAQISHISNAGLTQSNHGVEMAGLYLHVPVNMIFKQ